MGKQNELHLHLADGVRQFQLPQRGAQLAQGVLRGWSRNAVVLFAVGATLGRVGSFEAIYGQLDRRAAFHAAQPDQAQLRRQELENGFAHPGIMSGRPHCRPANCYEVVIQPVLLGKRICRIGTLRSVGPMINLVLYPGARIALVPVIVPVAGTPEIAVSTRAEDMP